MVLRVVSFLFLEMRSLITLLFCATLIVTSLQAQDVDHTKCSLDYIRQIVMESCIRPLRYRRHSHHIINGEDATTGMANNHERPRRLTPQFHLIDYDRLPINSTLVIKRKNKRKRSIDSQYDVYFHYCCNHMDVCEKLECP